MALRQDFKGTEHRKKPFSPWKWDALNEWYTRDRISPSGQYYECQCRKSDPKPTDWKPIDRTKSTSKYPTKWSEWRWDAENNCLRSDCEISEGQFVFQYRIQYRNSSDTPQPSLHSPKIPPPLTPIKTLAPSITSVSIAYFEELEFRRRRGAELNFYIYGVPVTRHHEKWMEVRRGGRNASSEDLVRT